MATGQRCKWQPSPSYTGVPELDDVKLWPNPYVDCNILVDYKDQRLPAIGCVTKIMRTWTIIEWTCITPQRTRTILQMIEIADTKVQPLLVQRLNCIYNAAQM